MNTVRRGYSALQIGLHWAVALLVAVQFFFHEAMEEAWDGFVEAGRSVSTLGSNLHIVAGLAILAFALSRLWIRFTRGAPSAPENEPVFFKIAARTVHAALYALLVAIPLGGIAAWFFDIRPAAEVHGLAATVLFWLVGLHIAGALFQQFVLKSGVLTRMAVPRD